MKELAEKLYADGSNRDETIRIEFFIDMETGRCVYDRKRKRGSFVERTLEIHGFGNPGKFLVVSCSGICYNFSELKENRRVLW